MVFIQHYCPKLMVYEAKRGFRRARPFIQTPKIIALAVYKASLLHDYHCGAVMTVEV